MAGISERRVRQIIQGELAAYTKQLEQQLGQLLAQAQSTAQQRTTTTQTDRDRDTYTRTIHTPNT